MAHHQMGEDPLLAAEGGVRRMLAPVVASSLTTIAAFLPLMLVGGVIGNILNVIPLVIVAVILASLLESMLVLPGHLRSAFVHAHKVKPDSLRAKLDRWLRVVSRQALSPVGDGRRSPPLLHHRRGLGRTGDRDRSRGRRPTGLRLLPDARGSDHHGERDLRRRHAARPSRCAARATERDAAGNRARLRSGQAGQPGDRPARLQRRRRRFRRPARRPAGRAHCPDAREVRNEEFIRAWRERIELPAGLEGFTIASRRAGPPGRDLTVRLFGADAQTLKAAALDISEVLKGIPGVSGSRGRHGLRPRADHLLAHPGRPGAGPHGRRIGNAVADRLRGAAGPDLPGRRRRGRGPGQASEGRARASRNPRALEHPAARRHLGAADDGRRMALAARLRDPASCRGQARGRGLRGCRLRRQQRRRHHREA
jgi:hypothetical protein